MSDLTWLPSISLARPWALALVPLPMAWLLLNRLSMQRDRARWSQLGQPALLRQMIVGPLHSSPWRTLLLILAWMSSSFALAGPQWGWTDDGLASGRDIVLVLDFSRSMWADDMHSTITPARWQAEIAAAKDMINHRRSGDRFAVVLFAARPHVLVPLTTDYDHLELRLSRLNARVPEIRPDRDDVRSGTRIGAALQTAVAQHDPRFPGTQDILLLTDADDPAADGEWRIGVDAARAAGIPVHVIALGDPTRETLLTNDGQPIEGPMGDGMRSPVKTRLHEDVAQAIAVESRGEYIAARTARPELKDFDRRVLDAAPHRELRDERRPQPHDRSAGFVGVALIFVLATCILPIHRA